VLLSRGFELVQTENLGNWQGILTCDEWQRIMLQARALTGKPEPTLKPLDLAEIPAAYEPKAPAPKAGEKAHSGLGASGLTIFAGIMLIGTLIIGIEGESRQLTGTVTLAALAVSYVRSPTVT